MKFWKTLLIVVAVLSVALIPSALADTVTDGVDVKVTNDNNNVDGGTPNPGFDAQNRQANEPGVAISPADPNIVAVGANDYRMVPVFGDSWLGFYLSDDGGATWFNTMVPGFGSDTSEAGLASPLLGLDGSGDPVVRFDAEGNLYVSGIAFNRNFDQEDLYNDNLGYVAKYLYTPGSPGGTSTPNSAANPPDFTYAFTTVVDRGAVGYAVPAGWGFAGKFVDKDWMMIDTNPDSPCFGNVYFTYTKFTGVMGAFPIVFSRSTDGGATFSQPRPISQRGKDGTVSTQGSNISVGPDGTVYVAYRTFPTSADPGPSTVQVVRSDNCGRHFGKPVTAATFFDMIGDGLSFRTPSFAWIAADDTDPNTVYIAFMGRVDASSLDTDIYATRSSDGGFTWEAPVRVNDDATSKYQFWPAIDVSNGALHVVWYDFRNSPNPGDPTVTNDALDVYYAATNASGAVYPAFTSNVRVTDLSHQPNCLMFGGGTAAFHGDYIELDAYFDGANHIVHVAWADNRDVPAAECDLNPDPGPPSNNIGNRNQNIYADKLTVSP